jgi:hypothetical protein
VAGVVTFQESELDYYQGETPRGSEGDAHVRKRISTSVLLTGGDDRDLERAELNELLGYLGFNTWDALAGTGDDPDPELIPLAECQAFGQVQAWQRYPDIVRFITDQVGPDGVAEIGGTSRREIGTKVNRSHIWGAGVNPAFGRGVSMGLGQLAGHEREADLAASLQFARRLGRGLWGGAGEPLFASMRGYAAPVLDPEWLTRFADERTSVDDQDARARYRELAGDLARLASLVHFGNRCATHDSGPYPAPGGGSVLVRDHFPADDLYHWADVADELPHAITCAYFLAPGPELALSDAGPTRSAELFDRLTGIAVYARDRWDTPADAIRLMAEAELDAVATRCRAASTRIHRRIAAMSRRDKVMAGGQVQYLDFLAPFARAAGVWDRLRDEFDVYEWDPLASEAYYPLVTGGLAVEMVPRLISTGAGFAPVKDAISGEEAFPALHLLAVRGSGQELPVDPNDLVSAGLVAATDDGYALTEAGNATHRRQLAAERYSYEPTRLAQAYERFLAQDEPLRAIVARWDSADQAGKAEMFAELTDILGRVRVALRRTNEQLLRFEGYLPRLRKALGRVEQGEHDYLAGPVPDSFNAIWSELHQDYRITQGLKH